MIEPKINYLPRSIGFADGFFRAKQIHGSTPKIKKFDLDVAMQIVDSLLDKQGKNIACVTAGLDGDWFENSGILYDKETGIFNQLTFHDSSYWAVPGILITFDDEPSMFCETWIYEQNK